MYTGHGFNEWGIGDIDVIRVGELYHLFHLVLPNHAYIAHATSPDGLSWTRVKNAIFLGDPGEWDDDMLWTMQISPDPDQANAWRMFYTGLKRTERGRIQRVGLAVSDDLYTWRKVKNRSYPLEISNKHYESSLDQGRHWVSFRDPFFCCVNGERWLLCAARTSDGPLIRRGCVSLAREVQRDMFVFDPPLHHPRVYDDIEVPGLVHLEDMWYLIGSIREDIKVHYWYSADPKGPYLNFFDNVLLPQGNYAARVCRDRNRVLIWNFFFTQQQVKGLNNLLPPPKELVKNVDGELHLQSFSGFDAKVTKTLLMDQLTPFRSLHQGEYRTADPALAQQRFGSDSSQEIYLLQGSYQNFRLRGQLTMEGNGKCGLVFHLDSTSSGYFLSLDLFKGLAQIRAWGLSKSKDIEQSFLYKQLQAAYFVTPQTANSQFELLTFGNYLEFSLDGKVLLSLADHHYQQGEVGFYTESAALMVEELVLELLEGPADETCHPLG